ncbi:hypothetical protein OROMI_008365 [Orobanche minor]
MFHHTQFRKSTGISSHRADGNDQGMMIEHFFFEQQLDIDSRQMAICCSFLKDLDISSLKIALYA